MRFGAVLLLAGLFTGWANGVAEARGCGIAPIPPIPPIGCKAMVPECVCDARGNNCWWEFRCVR